MESEVRRQKTEDSCEIPLWERLLAAIKARTSPPIAVISKSAIRNLALCALRFALCGGLLVFQVHGFSAKDLGDPDTHFVKDE
jgi:hypothetical protein